jgi:hypothetical protein
MPVLVLRVSEAASRRVVSSSAELYAYLGLEGVVANPVRAWAAHDRLASGVASPDASKSRLERITPNPHVAHCGNIVDAAITVDPSQGFSFSPSLLIKAAGFFFVSGRVSLGVSAEAVG